MICAGRRSGATSAVALRRTDRSKLALRVDPSDARTATAWHGSTWSTRLAVPVGAPSRSNDIAELRIPEQTAYAVSMTVRRAGSGGSFPEPQPEPLHQGAYLVTISRARKKGRGMTAAVFALAGTLLGILGTLAVELMRSRTEDARVRQEAVRNACADFTAAIARMRTLAMELRNKHPDSEQMTLIFEAHRDARVHYERLRLTVSSQTVQMAGRRVLRYAYGMLRQTEGKPLRDDEIEHGPIRMLQDSLMILYTEVRRELGVPHASDIYREPDEWIGATDPGPTSKVMPSSP
jgi:hypothetical protein